MLKRLTALAVLLATLLQPWDMAIARQLGAGHPLPILIDHVGGGGSAADQTLTIRGTQTLDVTAAVTTATSQCTNTELVAFTHSGTIPLQVFPFHDGGTDGGTWYKRELIDIPTALTSAQSDASNVDLWTFTCSGGASTIGWSISSPEIDDWNYGALTAATDVRAGGYPLSNLPGYVDDTAANTVWQPSGTAGSCLNASSAAVACNTLWETIGGHVVVKCVGTTTQCPVADTAANQISTYHNGLAQTTATAAAVPLTGDVSVALVGSGSQAGQTRTIIMHMIPNQWDIAPDPSWVLASGRNVTQLCTVIRERGTHLGDVIMAEANPGEAAQNYSQGTTGNAAFSCPMKSTSAPIYRAGTTTGNCGTLSFGPCRPHEPYDPGFIQVRPRQPWSARMNQFIVPVNASGVSISTTAADGSNAHRAPFLRFSYWDTYTDGNYGFTLGTADSQGMHQFDHNKMGWVNEAGPYNALPGAGVGSYDAFITDNKITGDLSGKITATLYGYDMKFDGNDVSESYSDVVDFAMLDSNPAVPRSSISWNFIHNVYDAPDCSHTDMSQSFYSSVGGTPTYIKNLTGHQRGPRWIGTVMIKGAPATLTANLGAQDVGSSSGTIVTVTSVTSGTIQPGYQLVESATGSANATVLAYGSGGTTGTGGVGTYKMSGTVTSNGAGTTLHFLTGKDRATNALALYTCAYTYAMKDHVFDAGQGWFHNNATATADYGEKFAGSAAITDFGNGAAFYQPGPGTTLRRSLILHPDYVTAATGVGGFGGTYVTESGGAPTPQSFQTRQGAIVTWENTISQSLISGSTTDNAFGFIGPNTSKIGTLDNFTDQSLYFADPFNKDVATLQRVINHYTPIGSAIGKGPFGDLAVINHRARILGDASLLNDNPALAAVPECVARPVATISGTFPHIAGDVVSVMSNAGFTLSPTSTGYSFYTYGGVGGTLGVRSHGSGTSLSNTYTLTSADIISGRIFEYIEGANLADGQGVLCTSVDMPIK